MKGLILNGTNNFFDVDCEDGNVRHCSIKGKILKGLKEFYNPLAPGDFVLIEEDPHCNGAGQITELLPRKNRFLRRNTKLNAPQLLACNIDLLLCLTTPDEPPFRPRFTDRVLVQAVSEDIPVIIVMNKCDLPQSPLVTERFLDWERVGFKVRQISAKTGEGIASLVKELDGLTVALTGQSGVGKSSLINAIAPKFNLKTAGISAKYGRGTHTTTQGSLFKIEQQDENGLPICFSLIDTPGIRNFSIWGIEPDELILYFSEMSPFVGKCKFALSCSHEREDGCMILQALNEGKILQDRYESWHLIKNELKDFLINGR